MLKQIRHSKEALFGTADINRSITPNLIATIRRHDPDGGSPVPYLTGLSGTSLVIQLGGDFSGTLTINFISNSYAEAIALINTSSPSNLMATDQDGFLLVKNLNPGGLNFIKIMPCTSATIFGFSVDPHPYSIKYAGDINQTLPSIYENSSTDSTMIGKNETVNRQNINRAIASISSIFDPIINDLEKEITIPKSYDITINGASFTVANTDKFFINANNNITVNPTSDILDNFIDLTDTNNNLIFDSSGNRVRVSSVTYGTLTSAATSFSNWLTADGKSVFGPSSHWNKVKTTATITSIIGNAITCTGALFITRKISPNDTVQISGATNKIPFIHNGEFVVEKVISENIIQVKAKGTKDYNYSGGETPSCLNVYKQVGESFGTLTIIVGRHLPFILPSGNMTFNLTSSLPNGTYRVTLPVGRTLKSVLSDDLTASTINSPFGSQIELGSKLITTLSNALKPRIISKPNSDTSLTLFAEFKNGTIATRIYTQLSGGVQIVSNGIWDGTSFTKEDNTKEILFFYQDGSSVYIGTPTSNFIVDGITGNTRVKSLNNFYVNDGTLDTVSFPRYDGTLASHPSFKAGVKLGTGFSTDNQHLVEKINYACNTTTGKYTLLTETVLPNMRRREYVQADGSSVSTTNAKWNGTTWNKDIAGSSSKTITDSDNIRFYTNTGTSLSFSDSAFQGRDEIRNFQFNEDFVCNVPKTNDTTNKTFGSLFKVETGSNTACYSNILPDSGNLGELIGQALAASAYYGDYSGNALSIPTDIDFEIRIKAKTLAGLTLGTLSPSLLTGLIMGNWDASTGNNRVLLRASSDNLNWHIQVLSTTFDTLIPRGNTISVIFKRINGTLMTYINNILFNTSSFLGGFTMIPSITYTGTASGTNQDIFSIDYFQVWVGLGDR